MLNPDAHWVSCQGCKFEDVMVRRTNQDIHSAAGSTLDMIVLRAPIVQSGDIMQVRCVMMMIP